MRELTRRDFLKYSGAGLAGLTMAMHFPFLTPRRALASSGAWKFGVMADTQWKSGYPNEGQNPASCAVAIINALNAQFIGHGVKYVIQVGDLVDVESVNNVRTLQTRAAATQALYNQGIGFFPLRGNHESTATAAGEVQTLFPQTQGTGSNPLAGATNFSSPFSSLQGLSYSFDVENVRCVLIDQFVRTDGTNVSSSEGSYNANATDQVSWVDSRLSSKPSGSHAFVFSHKNLIGQNHKDGLFGKTLTSNASARNDFITSLAANGVRYQLGGHDHMHHRSIVKTSNGNNAEVGQIICSSNSYKFYIPAAGDDGRETPLTQELASIGYYIFTIDGPRVFVDFYSSSHGSPYGDIDLLASPAGFNFYLRESFGYSLNGKQFKVARGESFTSVQDSFEGTTVKILGGTNGNTETDYLGRNLVKTVNTGWSASDAIGGAASKVVSIWGMVDNLSLWEKPASGIDYSGLLPCSDESKQGDTYVLSLSYDPTKVRPTQLIGGRFCLANRKLDGSLINAVEANFGGTKAFKYGPCKSSYGLGTYGVDPGTRTVWAVINYDGDFFAKLF